MPPCSARAATRRAIGSVLGLRWDDLDFAKREIRWLAELDKRRKTWVTPMPAVATKDSSPTERKTPQLGRNSLPSRKNPSRPITSHLASYWLRRAFEIAKIENRPEHSGMGSHENARRNAGIAR